MRLFRNRYVAPLFSIVIAALVAAAIEALPNTEIFQEQEAAKKFITFDGQSFLIYGMRTFLTCGEIHYARVPRELWRDRLVRAKMAGFNTIATYVFWNAHEPEEGQFDFSGSKDFGAFLDLCKELRLHVFIRLGPYSCAEWDLGGFPAWLAVGKGVRLRTDDPEYLKYVDRWFEKLLPIVAQRQIHKGGCVIMVQLENEYSGGWGTEEDAYLAHLRKKALEMGIEVPMFYSGLRHSHDPAADKPWPRTSNSPWFTTEFWPGWYDRFGELPDDEVAHYDRATRKILAFGGAGYSYYMLHGGTNFGYTSNDEISTSYDFSAPIGESGALRKSYFRFKKDAIFAATFGHILVSPAPAEKGLKVNSGELAHYLCSTPRGNILFLDNQGDKPITARIEIEGRDPVPMVKPLTLVGGEILPMLIDMPLGAGVTISHCSANVLSIRRMRDRMFIFIYGRENEPGEIVFQLEAALSLISGVESYIMDSTGRTVIISFDFPGAWQKKDFAFQSGVANIQVVALNDKLAERVWFDPWGAGPAVVVGPYFVREMTLKGKSAKIAAEFIGDEKACYIYTGQPMRLESQKSSKLIAFEADKMNFCLNGKVTGFPDAPKIPQLGDWQFAHGAPEMEPDFDDSTWASSDDPKDMGAMPGAHRTFYGWYRCSFDSAAEGEGKLEFPFAGDSIYLFANGKLAGKADGRGPQSLPVRLQKGRNLLAVLARHSGRDKLYNFSGVAGLKVATGIHGPVKLTTESGSQVLKGWRYRAGLVGEEKEWFRPEKQSDVKWQAISEEMPKDVPTFFSCKFAWRASPDFSEVLRLKTSGLSHGTLWLNDRIIGQYVPDGEYYLPEPWLKEENLLVLADEECKSPENVTLVREDPAAAHRADIVLTAAEGRQSSP